MASALDPETDGVWLVALFLQTFVYGIAILQAWDYFVARPTDRSRTKITVSDILCKVLCTSIEHLQVVVVLCVTTGSLQLQP